jgi:hypothetical protein
MTFYSAHTAPSQEATTTDGVIGREKPTAGWTDRLAADSKGRLHRWMDLPRERGFGAREDGHATEPFRAPFSRANGGPPRSSHEAVRRSRVRAWRRREYSRDLFFRSTPLATPRDREIPSPLRAGHGAVRARSLLNDAPQKQITDQARWIRRCHLEGHAT